MIVLTTAEGVVASAREALRLPSCTYVDDAYWVATLRRLAGQLCPCSPRTLIAAAIDSHQSLVAIDDTLSFHLEELVDTLTVVGDLLELSDVTTLDETVRATWLFVAPPSFVLHTSGSVFIVGLTSDDPLPMPAELRERVQSRGAVRILAPLEGEDLPALLDKIGFRALSLEVWGRHPKLESAHTLLAGLEAKVQRSGIAGEVYDIRVLDWSHNERRYRNRWRAPAHQTGLFVVRRPQAYGADLWGYGRFNNGHLEALIDFPLPGTHWRGCDTAWRIQLAIDAERGQPQRYRRTLSETGSQLDFFYPLPEWARRRLGMAGEEIEPNGCLLSFRISRAHLDAEENFLRDYLFFERDEQPGEGSK